MILANILQPLVDAFNAVIKAFHDTLGISWGLSIILLTICVRLLLVPLAVKQFKSMQGLQRIAPELKKLQEKYKDDKQRLQQETMRFYQEHKVNPFASCLPLLAQLPVFFALFYALRTDLREDMCQQTLKPCGEVPGDWGEGFLFIPDITDKATGGVLIALIALYVGSQLLSSLLMMTPTTDRNQKIIFLALPFFFTLFIFNFPAGLIMYWITTNLWTIVQQRTIRRVVGTLPPLEIPDEPEKPTRGGARRPAAAAATAAGGSAKAPPPPPRRKRKQRSGRRR
ncbi:YidC/Oxa1 family membrane protein insertase [Conexibacter sp. SYSU D00693]|uniref:YidC/Oxa1 family membrane protein insertase n=1 Tax=Conexibacter sp. SYSU D00693 TaxID=2812560 RepID=UPI00196BAC59|nr:YidC/Oxa1 family membrane protein insertase [Conexibacter sp. SYSU D00693]